MVNACVRSWHILVKNCGSAMPEAVSTVLLIVIGILYDREGINPGISLTNSLDHFYRVLGSLRNPV